MPVAHLVSGAMTDSEQNIAWTALEKGTPIVSSDGEEAGKVTTVVADEAKDIFSGISFRHRLLDSEHFIPADLVESITTKAVYVKLDSEAVKELGHPEAK